MVQEALDGLTDEQIAELERQDTTLGVLANTPFAEKRGITMPEALVPAPAAAEEPDGLTDYDLRQMEEENYRRVDYVMPPEEFEQYWTRRKAEDNEVGRFIEGMGQGVAGLVGMVPQAGRELQGAMVGMVTDPVNQVQRNVQTGAEIIRKGGVNLVQLYDWVANKVDDVATSSKRAEVVNAQIRERLQAEGQLTGNRDQDEQIFQAALVEARGSGAYNATPIEQEEDSQKAYDRYVREKSFEQEFANVSQFKTGESQMSAPTSAETYQITDEKPMETISTLGSMVVDPLNAVPLGAGALSKLRVLRRVANLSEAPLKGIQRGADGLADVAERVEFGITSRVQDVTGLNAKQQAALGAAAAGGAIYADQMGGGGNVTKAVAFVGGVLPALHYGGGLLRKIGGAAGAGATVVREAGVGGLGVARAEAAANLAGNAAVPERYRKFFKGYTEGTDSTLKRVTQDAANPELLRRYARLADRVGVTQAARLADDAVSGAVTAGVVGVPFAALQPDAERAGEVFGGLLAFGAVGGAAGGMARRRSGDVANADIARMFADVQAVGGNVEAFARLPHATLDRLSSMQGVLAGKVDFIPLNGDEYRMNADIAQNAGETTAGLFIDKDANNRARVFINLDAKRDSGTVAPHEIGHAILTSDILDGQPRADLRNLVNQQYGPEGVAERGREYIGRLIDGDIQAKATGEAPTVLTETEFNALERGTTIPELAAERAKDPAVRERLINERVEEFSQRSIEKGQDPLDWARDEIIAETFASEAPAIDFRAIRRDALFPRLAESMLSAGGRVLEVMGARLDQGTGKLMDNPSVLFRDNPLFQDRIMQKRVREYVRSYDQYLAGLEEAGTAAPRGVELARSNRPEDLGRSTHVKLRDEGRGVLENDFLFQRPDGTYSFKPQKLVNQTEASRAAQIKTLYDARKFVPVNSTEFGRRKVNGRETVGGPVLPKQFDFFTHFPQHVREFARSMEQSRAEGGSWDIDYNAIGTGASGRYRVTNLGNVRAIQRETVPFGWQVTKVNHLLAASLDLNAFRAASMKAINKGDLGLFNNDMKQVEADLKAYLANHRAGLPGEATIGVAKRDMLNGLIGTGTAVQRTANPLYYELNPRGSIRTWRVDRLNDAKPTGRTGYFFDYDKANNNRMPQAIPREAQGMPDVVPARTLDTDRLLREYEENQGYLGLSTMGMREGRPTKSGAAETRRLLARNTEINRELDARGVLREDPSMQKAMAARGQAMPDVAPSAINPDVELPAAYRTFVRPGGVDVSMTVGGKPMTYNIEFLDLDRAGDSSQPQFREVNQKLGRAGIPAWEMQFSADGLALLRSTDVSLDSVYKITGLGNARKVLNSIAETATDYAAREQLQVVFFSADKPTRQRTYEMLARQMADRMPDHSVYKYSSDKGGQYALIRNEYRDRALKAMGVDGAKLISAKGATGRARGQAMPDVGSFDQDAGAYLIAAGDGESLPVYQQADKRGKPAVDGTGKAKFVPVDYDLLHGPGITKYTGPGPEDVTKPDYKGMAYDITQKGQREIDAAIDSGAVDSAANRVVDFTVEAMKNREIAAGKGWYSRMRDKLLSAFGEKGRELFAQLLGATSAKTPVEPNFLQAFDAFEGINSGRYDRHRKAYLDMLESEDGNNLTAVIVERGYTSKVRAMADSLSKESRKLKGKKKAEVLFKAGKLRDLAKKPASQWTRKDRFDITILAENILPLRSNGKKFNSNSHAVLKVIAGTWLNNRKSPKTPNFAGNLTGRTLQATIDVWAARHLRELLYGGSNEPWRIQPRSEVGVNPQDFALGQIIMQRAAKKLDMNPDDLQAILWFAEKNKWDANGWTGTEGANKSSFDTTFDRAFPSGQKPLTFQEVSKILSEED